MEARLVKDKNPSSRDDYTDQIIYNLKILRISDECIARIMNAVNNMPGKDHIKGALKFFTEITAEKSRREDYYQYSSYIAEYFCTISNIGLFAVAFYYGDFAALLAATFSALSHAIPLQRLHDLDMLGIFVVFGKAIADYKVIMERPELMAWGVGAMTVNVLDTMITRTHLNKIGPSLHFIWHLSAALALYKLNQAEVEVTTMELASISEAAVLNEIPDFLQTCYATISDYINGISFTSKCVIC